MFGKFDAVNVRNLMFRDVRSRVLTGWLSHDIDGFTYASHN